MILLMPLLKRNVLHMDQMISTLKNTEKILVQTNSSNQTRFDTDNESTTSMLVTDVGDVLVTSLSCW